MDGLRENLAKSFANLKGLQGVEVLGKIQTEKRKLTRKNYLINETRKKKKI